MHPNVVIERKVTHVRFNLDIICPVIVLFCFITDIVKKNWEEKKYLVIYHSKETRLLFDTDWEM